MPKNVSITFFINEEPYTSIVVQKNISLYEIRQRWQETSKDSRDVHFLRDSAVGTVLPEDGFLKDILPPGKALFVLHVVPAEKRSVWVIGCVLAPITVRLFPHETPEALMQRIKVLFDIGEERCARLLCGGQVFTQGSPAVSQLSGHAGIEVDLQLPFVVCRLEPFFFEPALFDPLGNTIQNCEILEVASNPVCKGVDPSQPFALPVFPKTVDVRIQRLFASETVRALDADDPLTWRAKALDSDLTVGSDRPVWELASKDAILSGSVSGVVLERRMEVRLEEKLRNLSKTMLVWPSSKFEDFLTNENDSVLLGGETMNPHQSLWEAGVQEGSSLCITRLLNLTVVEADTGIRRITVDLGDSLLDLRDQLSLPAKDFELWNNDEMLHGEDRTLLELELDDSSCLMARHRTRFVSLTMGNAEPVFMGDVRKTTTFHAFLREASRALKTPLSQRTCFVCPCGRVFSNEGPQRREFPFSCCSASELRFAVVQSSRSECCI